jgi:uncharacterized protein (DUF433 family)
MQAPVIYIQIDTDGHPRTIQGNVKVHMIAKKYRAGETIPSIAEHYGISSADVHGALAYYHDNRTYFDERERDVAPLIEAGQMESAKKRAQIEERLRQQKK